MSCVARILSAFGLVLAVGLVPGAVYAQAPPSDSTTVEFARVRSSSARLTTLIAEAVERSQTFRALMASVEKTDGIVFIEDGRCPRSAVACLTWQVTLAGPYRLLFVRLDARESDVDLMASAGHELQHALEVLGNRSLRSTAAIQLFYMQGLSPETPRNVETVAAKRIGDAVFLEVRQSRSR